MPPETLSHSFLRRVVLLQTDERAGLVTALTAACAAREVSLDIVTGPGHVLVTFAAPDPVLARLRPALEAVPGVAHVHFYQVLPRREPSAAAPAL